MVTNIADAISKYSQAGGLPKIGGASDDGLGAGGTSFADLMKQTMQDVASTQTRSEQMGQQAAVGKANLVDVMTAINNASMTLQTVTSIRDRLVTAIQSVMQTAI